MSLVLRHGRRPTSLGRAVTRGVACLVAVAAVLGTTVLATVLLSSPARACSCAGGVPAADLVGEREIAFVGVASRGREVEPGVLEYEVTVELAVKGAVPAVVQVRAGMDEASCGVAVPTGRPVGFVPSDVSPTGRRDGWSVDLCSGLVDVNALVVAASAELPPPTGRGPVRAILVARAGPAEAVAVAADGRPAGWVDVPGSGFVDVMGAAACPGGATGTLLVARYDDTGSPAATEVHRIDFTTLEVDERPLATADPVPFGPWAVAGSACVDDEGTTVVLVDDDGDGVPDALDRIAPTAASAPEPAEPGEAADVGEGPSSIDGTRLAQVVDGAVLLRDLISAAPPASLFALDHPVAVTEIDLFGDAVYLTSTAADGASVVERRTFDGTIVTSWRVPDMDVRQVSVGEAGVLLWDGTTGRQRLLRDDGDPIDLAGDFGGALLGDGVLTWGFDGAPQYVLADGTLDPSWSFLHGGRIRYARPLQATVAVDPASPAAGPLPIVGAPGIVVPVEIPTTEAEATTAATTDGRAEAAPPADEPTAVVTGGDRSSRPRYVTVLLGVAAVGVVAVLAAVVGRTRRRRRAHSGG